MRGQLVLRPRKRAARDFDHHRLDRVASGMPWRPHPSATANSRSTCGAVRADRLLNHACSSFTPANQTCSTVLAAGVSSSGTPPALTASLPNRDIPDCCAPRLHGSSVYVPNAFRVFRNVILQSHRSARVPVPSEPLPIDGTVASLRCRSINRLMPGGTCIPSPRRRLSCGCARSPQARPRPSPGIGAALCASARAHQFAPPPSTTRSGPPVPRRPVESLVDLQTGSGKAGADSRDIETRFRLSSTQLRGASGKLHRPTAIQDRRLGSLKGVKTEVKSAGTHEFSAYGVAEVQTERASATSRAPAGDAPSATRRFRRPAPSWHGTKCRTALPPCTACRGRRGYPGSCTKHPYSARRPGPRVRPSPTARPSNSRPSASTLAPGSVFVSRGSVPLRPARRALADRHTGQQHDPGRPRLPPPCSLLSSEGTAGRRR